MGKKTHHFSLVRVEAKGSASGACHALRLRGRNTGFLGEYEAIRAQYWLDNCRRYLVVLENAPWEGVNYKFLLLDAGGEVVDAMHLYYASDEKFSFMMNERFCDGAFHFRKDGRRYLLRIDQKGRLRYAVRDLRRRNLIDFMRPRKFLSLSVLRESIA